MIICHSAQPFALHVSLLTFRRFVYGFTRRRASLYCYMLLAAARYASR